MPEQLELRQVSVDRWLTPKEVAWQFGLQEDSAYRWIDDGTIPEQFVVCCGRWRKRIHPDVIPLLKQTFRTAQGLG